MNKVPAGIVLVGLVGGIASGKSTVAKLLQELGAEWIDADKLGHEVLNDEAAKREIGQRWPQTINSTGGVDRQALAGVVFGQNEVAAAELKKLEEITHPRITQRMLTQLAEIAAKHGQSVDMGVFNRAVSKQTAAGKIAADESKKVLVALDAPVMFKSCWHEMCRHIVFVDSPLPARETRAGQRGWSKEEFSAREAAQESVADKRARADFVLDNSKGIDELRRQVVQLYADLIDSVPSKKEL